MSIKSTNPAKKNLPAMFPDRLDEEGKFEVPKMLIFANQIDMQKILLRLPGLNLIAEIPSVKRSLIKVKKNPKQ